MAHPEPSRKSDSPLFETFAQGVVEEAVPGDREAARLRRVVEGVLVPFLRGRRLETLGTRDIERLVGAHARAGLATKRRILHALGTLLVRAVERGHVKGRTSLARRRLRDLSAQLPLVTRGEQAAFLEALAPTARPLFEVALESGARIRELLRLTWADVDLGTRSLLVRRDDGRPRVLPLSDALCTTIGAGPIVCTAPDARVFAEAQAEDGTLRWAWRVAFRQAACEVGAPMLRVGDLRHLAAIRMVEGGVDLCAIQARMGYADVLSMLRCAAHLDRRSSSSRRPQRRLRREA